MQARLTGPDAPDRLLIVGRWAYYATGMGAGLDARNSIALTGYGQTGEAAYAAAWGPTLAVLSPHIPEIFVLRQPPELPALDSRDIARDLAHGRATAEEAALRGTLPVADAAQRDAPGLAPIAALSGITLIDPWPRLCAPDCHAAGPDGILYFDTNHLRTGARWRCATSSPPSCGRSMTDPLTEAWDVIVIGTGVGGGTAARALAEGGLRVLMLEQGPAGYRSEETRLSITMEDRTERLKRGFWPERLALTVDGRTEQAFTALGAGVGGTSVFYAATLERPARHDVEPLPGIPTRPAAGPLAGTG